MNEEPLGSELLYSTCWEDLATARAALRVSSGDTVVAIAAAGDNAIGLLLDDPGRLIAIDVNPAQIALVELKIASIVRLGGRAGPFLGALPARRRLTAYARLREELSAGTCAFWDARPTAISRGVLHAGRFERYVGGVRSWLLPIVPGRRVVRAMLGARDVAEQRRVYRERWDSPFWRATFRAAFGRRVLSAFGRHPSFFVHAGAVDVPAHFRARVAHGLSDFPLRQNPYMTFALTGRYALPTATPEYLLADNAAAIAARRQRIELACEPLLAVLRRLPSGSVDAFYLSDVFELCAEDEFETALGEVARVGKPGARVCYWNNLVPRTRPAHLARLLSERHDVVARLAPSDRGFLYSRLVVEQVLGVPASGRELAGVG